jgi:hypothetical protein
MTHVTHLTHPLENRFGEPNPDVRLRVTTLGDDAPDAPSEDGWEPHPPDEDAPDWWRS